MPSLKFDIYDAICMTHHQPLMFGMAIPIAVADREAQIDQLAQSWLLTLPLPIWARLLRYQILSIVQVHSFERMRNTWME